MAKMKVKAYVGVILVDNFLKIAASEAISKIQLGKSYSNPSWTVNYWSWNEGFLLKLDVIRLKQETLPVKHLGGTFS